jgi:hypothetical protein
MEADQLRERVGVSLRRARDELPLGGGDGRLLATLDHSTLDSENPIQSDAL